MRRLKHLAAGGGALVLAPAPLAAHAGVAPGELSRAWVSEPLAAVLLGVLAISYGLGLERLWRRAGAGHGIRRSTARLFALGLLVLAAALLSPLHALGETLFAAHMTQHVLLMSVAAPLLLLGRPMLAALWALPREARLRTGRLVHARPVRRTWRLLSTPLAAWSIHALVLWGWHAPALYDASVQLRWVHALQHASFFAAAMLFWWVLLWRLSTRRTAGIGVLYVFTTAVHSSLLGALLTFARGPWYASYAESTAAWGLTPLEDLQLGGLVMWVPGGLPYLVAMLALAARWLQERPAVTRASAAVATSLLLVLLTAGCGEDAQRARANTGIGDASRGPALIRAYGCHSCHRIPGVRGADGRIGPPLDDLGARIYIAGSVPNTPRNLVRFIVDPTGVRPDTGMPDVHASERDARDMAAYLYSLSR